MFKKIFYISCIFNASLIFAKDIKKEDYLKPEDLGMSKYSFTVKPQNGNFTVIRKEVYLDEKLKSVHDLISYKNDESKKINIKYSIILSGYSEYLKGTHPQTFRIKSPNGEMVFHDIGMSSIQESNNSILFLLKEKKSWWKIKFTSLHIKHDVLSSKIKNLPDFNKSQDWSYNHIWKVSDFLKLAKGNK